MKKLLLSILIFLMAVTPSWALTTYNCNYLTGGNARALDYLSVSDLSDGDRAIIVYQSGVSHYYVYFRYDASGTTAENTTAHPYYVRPNDYATAGVWVEVTPKWVDLGASLSMVDLTITGTLTVSSIVATGSVQGGIVVATISNTATLSGATKYGGYVTSKNATSGVTVTVPTAGGAGENFVIYIPTDTFNSGGTIYVHFTAGDSLRCNQDILAGVSKFILSGTTFQKRIFCFSGEAGIWNIMTFGAPTVDWD
jgi:hypothetical protein